MTRPGPRSAEDAADFPAAFHEDAGPVYQISEFRVRYRDPQAGQPDLFEILPLDVRLGVRETGLVAPGEGQTSTVVRVGWKGEPVAYHATAIGAVSRELVAALRGLGLLGVYVLPDPSQIDPKTEADLRPEGETKLTLLIVTARDRNLRTIASGDRIESDWRIDNAAHLRIRELSPVQPTAALREGTTDLALEDVLDDYLFRLNRHPGRRVDAALAPAADGDGVDVDFLVHESKAWYAYGQTSNTGTDTTFEWQQRFGFVDNQLSDRDDILSIEYTNAGDASNGVNFFYEAPWFSSKRPWWWSTPAEGPDWLSWLDRSKLPWFGSDFMRWRVWGSFTDYTAKQVEGVSDIQGRDWNVGGRLLFNVFQHRAFFVDLFGGAELRGVEVDNDAALNGASETFLLPQVGVQADRVDEVSSFFGLVLFEGNPRSINQQSLEEGGNPTLGIEALGRSNPDDKWAVVRFDFSGSQYLEPLMDPRGWQDPQHGWTRTLAHELALDLRGQYAFNYRLIPQAEEVLGGLYSVRGYKQSTAVGDNVVIGSFEYRFHLPRSLPIRPEPLNLPGGLGRFRVAPQQVYGQPDWDLILRAFVDAGVSHHNKRPARCPSDPLAPCPDDRERLEQGEVLVGTGVGAELRLRNNFRARVDWARALRSSNSSFDRVEAGHDEIYLFFSILY